MSTTRHNQVGSIQQDRRDWPLLSLKVEAELEKADCDAGHAYIPMDVFVDRATIRRHFQLDSIRVRLKETYLHGTVRRR